MSLLATLGLELDRTLLPASGLGWLVDYGKLPLAPAPLGPYEVLGGALEGGLPGGGEPLAGDGFSDWMTERVDFTALLPLEPPLPSGALPPPSPPPPDLEAMASLLKKELEQMEDYFLDAPLLPPSSPPLPPLPPPPPPPAPACSLPLPLPLPTFDLPQPPSLDTLDLLAIYCRSEAGQGDSGLAPPPQPPQAPPPPRPGGRVPGAGGAEPGVEGEGGVGGAGDPVRQGSAHRSVQGSQPEDQEQLARRGLRAVGGAGLRLRGGGGRVPNPPPASSFLPNPPSPSSPSLPPSPFILASPSHPPES
ncbi:hypothetical protein MJG53_013322 [Ovis ammon polii x Ovis aries]|uniref:Uncharacterized protein n=1 Tax=Ovis ammon polii x Ovis aries TaxID=2918886 RepID=A0ACB9UJ55_9CETA|nr:hypothetical protein MJG53_013322 [Ovis ammon polii x Ovis aries]